MQGIQRTINYHVGVRAGINPALTVDGINTGSGEGT